MSKYVREILLDIPPYIPGRPIGEVQRQYNLKKVYKLASNENPLGPSPRALTAIRKCLRDVNRYPDPSGRQLRGRLAEKSGLTPEHFMLGNGAAELIDHCAMAFVDPGSGVVLSSPTFPKYYLSARRLGGNVISVPMKGFHHDLDEIIDSVTKDTRLLFIDTPCNPVGSRLTIVEQKGLLERLPKHVVIVIDEAYREFVEDGELLDYAEAFSQYDNVIFLRTFSKSYGLSGLRIGYAVGHPDIITDLNRVREVFNTNSPAMAGALAALDDNSHLRKTLNINHCGKEYLYRHLTELGYEYPETHANFILVNVRIPLAEADEFLLKNGVITRPVKLNDIPGNWIRVSIGRQSENRAFIEALGRMKAAFGG